MRRHPLLARWLLAGPGVLLSTALVLLGMSVWLPGGAADIDQLALPLVLLPLVWAALFFHACLDRSLARVAAVTAALCALNGAVVVWHVAGLRHQARATVPPAAVAR